MENQNNRALRRHHAARVNNNRAAYFNVAGGRTDARSVGRALKTPAICSCALCGNPRKFRGEKTIQELRNEQRELGEVICISDET